MKRLVSLAVVAVVAVSGCSKATTDDLPRPQAVIENPQTDFGKVGIGQTVEHTFTIRNDGNAELLLDEPRPAEARTRFTVKCALSSRTIPPGESATAHVRVRPLEVSRKLYAGVYIGTNQPDVTLRIGGRLIVEPPLVVEQDEPGETPVWTIKSGSDGTPIAATGRLYSVEHERFSIRSVKSDHPAIIATVKPLPEKRRKKLQAKSGYAIAVHAAGLKTVGRFDGRITFTTDLPQDGTQDISVRGVRWGPVKVFQTDGMKWNPESATLDLGLFPAATGKTATMAVVIRSPAGGLPVLMQGAKSDSPALAVTAVKDDKRSTAAAAWFKLTFTVPPGRPPDTRTRDHPATISVRTSHPGATEIRLTVLFNSY